MGRKQYIVLVAVCLVYGAFGLPMADPLVETTLGAIRGVRATDGDYSMFMGIPYAKVDPLNPFGPSIPHEGFQSTFDAIDDSVVCPQRDLFTSVIIGSLDCLNINVFVPNSASSNQPLPVFVWIYGGGFNRGYARRDLHGPKNLVRYDVIVVTFNYRLGAYGFLCTDDARIPGNQGFKDQQTALRWIKSNIEAFGGDSNKITIGGQSAGGVSVDLHLTYGKEDLFNNVIIQSGTAFAPGIVSKPDPRSPFQLAAHLGLVTNDLGEAIEFLRQQDTNVIVEAAPASGVLSRPCEENEFDNVERFITGQPDVTPIPKLKNVTVLIGFVSNERGASFENMPPQVIAQFDPFALVMGSFDLDPETLAEMSQNVRRFYIGDEDLGVHMKQQVLDCVSDFGYNNPTTRRIENYIENGASSIYHYMFSYDGNRNFEKRRSNVQPNAVKGAVHEDEIGYMFDLDLFKNEVTSPEDQLTIDRITTLWTNFAKHSNPTPSVSDVIPVQWPAISDEAMFYLDIDSEVSVRKRPFHARMAYWALFMKMISL